MTILSLNCNSIYNKLSELKKILELHNPAIICLCETWLKDKYSPKFRNYTVEWKNRQERGGGFGLVIRQNIQYQPLPLQIYQEGILEVQAIKVHLKNSNNLTILNIYNPVKNVSLQELEFYIDQLGSNFLIIGDLNAHSKLDTNINRSNQTGKALENLLLQNKVCLINPKNMFTYIDRSTGKQSCLDLCLSSPNIALLVNIKPFSEIGSDHLILQTTIQLQPIMYEWIKTSRFSVTKEKLREFNDLYITSALIKPASTDELVEDLIERLSKSASECFGEPGEQTTAKKRTPMVEQRLS